jgi:hypothetical protein
MSKIHNMVRTLGAPGSDPEIVLPEGWELGQVVYLGPTNDQEKLAGFFKVLYVLVPAKVSECGVPNVQTVPSVQTSEHRGPGRPPKA